MLRTCSQHRITLAAYAGALLGLVACGSGGNDPDTTMRVVRISPAPRDDGSVRAFLNQDITVFFDSPVDRLSVTPDTVRLLDQNGNRLDGRLEVGLRSVTFKPIPPVERSLDDGTFAPDRNYRLEVVGMPLWNALRSTSGARLERGYAVDIHTVPAQPQGLGFDTPFLPVGGPSDAFQLQNQTARMAAETGRLQLHFTLPILPASVTADALQVFALLDGGHHRIEPRSVRVLREPRSRSLHHGTTLEVRFAPGAIDPAATHYVAMEGESGDRLRDYLGRELQGTSQLVAIHVAAGARERVLELGGSLPWRLRRDAGQPDAAFADFDGLLEPMCRVEAGDGVLGRFEPKQSMTIAPGVAFDRGDGTFVSSDGPDFRFSSIDVPAGVVVRIESDVPVTLRSAASARIRGRLVLDTPLVDAPFDPGAVVDFGTLRDFAGCMLIVGGHLVVEGVLRHVRETDPGSPMTLMCAGDVEPRGVLPPEVVICTDMGRPRILGVLESPRTVQCGMTRGVAGASVLAEGWTEWIRSPDIYSPSVDFELVDARGDIAVAVQVAPPHPVDPTRPDQEAHRVSQPTKVGEALGLLPGSFLRFRIGARVVAGAPLPSLGGVRVLAR